MHSGWGGVGGESSEAELEADVDVVGVVVRSVVEGMGNTIQVD